MSQPWFKFSPSAWRASPELRMCGMAARGLWAEMLCIMHEAEPRGYLIIGSVSLTIQQLANLAGISFKECSALILELENANVFSRNETGIYSRRMLRDTERALKDKTNGKSGGNPTLKAGVNPPLKATRARELRTENLEPEKIANAILREPDFDAESNFRQAIVQTYAKASSPVFPDTSRAAIWLARGHDPAICLATIAGILARKPSISSLNYFDQAIADAHVAPVGNARAGPAKSGYGKAMDFLERVANGEQHNGGTVLDADFERLSGDGGEGPRTLLSARGNGAGGLS